MVCLFCVITFSTNCSLGTIILVFLFNWVEGGEGNALLVRMDINFFGGGVTFSGVKF